LLFIGDGPEHGDLLEMVNNHSCDRIEFMPFLSQKQLKRYYKKASALILPSYSETWGLVINEAMASGLPVLVSTKCGCADTLVQNGTNGFTFDPFNEESMKRAILGYINAGSELREQMSDMAHKIISNWGLERFCDGAMSAILYCGVKKKRRGTIFGKIIIRFWNGQYRPV
jgi:1,2-diacylglycerol 3-alpha-glucosyltransferase